VTPPPPRSPRSPRTPPGTNDSSTVRLLIGAGLTIAAVSLALIGFIRLIGILEGGGYGTPRMRNALVVLGTSGALLASGIATVIWDLSKRYESPRQPQVGDRDSAG
jgi:uncharacterized membrane protein YqjE